MGFLAFEITFAFLLTSLCSLNILVFQKITGTEYLPLKYNFKFSSRLKHALPTFTFLTAVYSNSSVAAESTTDEAFVNANDPFS